MLCKQMEELATERQAAQVKRRALEKANRDLTTQCNEARTENCALHHQTGDLIAQKQEAVLRVGKFQVTNSVMIPDT